MVLCGNDIFIKIREFVLSVRMAVRNLSNSIVPVIVTIPTRYEPSNIVLQSLMCLDAKNTVCNKYFVPNHSRHLVENARK